MTIKTKSISMGLGPIGKPTNTFVCKFRFTLCAHDHDGKETLQQHYIKSAKVDFARQVIHFDSYEVFVPDSDDIEILSWLERDINRDVLTLTTYDGCGNTLYQYNFSGLHVIEQSASFDYGKSEESIRKAAVKFNRYHRIVNGKVVKHENDFVYKMKLADSPQIPVDIECRPSLTIQD